MCETFSRGNPLVFYKREIDTLPISPQALVGCLTGQNMPAPQVPACNPCAICDAVISRKNERPSCLLYCGCTSPLLTCESAATGVQAALCSQATFFSYWERSETGGSLFPLESSHGPMDVPESLAGIVPAFEFDLFVGAGHRREEKLLDLGSQTIRNILAKERLAMGVLLVRAKYKAIVSHGLAVLRLHDTKGRQQIALDDNTGSAGALMDDQAVEGVAIVAQCRRQKAPVVRVGQARWKWPRIFEKLLLGLVSQLCFGATRCFHDHPDPTLRCSRRQC